MAPQHGRLKRADHDKIQNNYEELLEIDPQYLTPFLYQKDVISQDDKEKIEVQETRKERAEVLLTKILNAGPGKAYSKFIEALNENGYEFLAEKIEKTSATTEEQGELMLDLPDEVLDMKMNDCSASKMSTHLGKGWEHLMIQLGLSSIVVDKEKGKGDMAITNLLVKWIQREGKKATWRRFFGIFSGLVDKGILIAEVDDVMKIAQEQT